MKSLEGQEKMIEDAKKATIQEREQVVATLRQMIKSQERCKCHGQWVDLAIMAQTADMIEAIDGGEEGYIREDGSVVTCVEAI